MSQQSSRQNLAQGGASAASGIPGHGPIHSRAGFSGRKNLSPAEAGSANLFFRRTGRGAALRFACPGLNSAARFAGSLSLVLLLLSSACTKKVPQTKATSVAAQPSPATTDKYPSLAIQSSELTDAFGKKDYARFVNLIHPKVIEMAGGREQMIAEMTKELKEMEDEGVVVLSSSCGEPTQFVHDGSDSIYAVLPITLKTKAQAGIFQSESTMIAVSSDGGANWKFIDASGKDQGELKKLIPGVADKLKLLSDKPAVKLSDN
ncbi:MAG: hypothetical protein ABR607_08455 [Pyrinomonadaceae bacterium]